MNLSVTEISSQNTFQRSCNINVPTGRDSTILTLSQGAHSYGFNSTAHTERDSTILTEPPKDAILILPQGTRRDSNATPTETQPCDCNATTPQRRGCDATPAGDAPCPGSSTGRRWRPTHGARGLPCTRCSAPGSAAGSRTCGVGAGYLVVRVGAGFLGSRAPISAGCRVQG